TGGPMTLDDFWVIVDDASGRANGNKARFLDTISVSLRNLSAHEIVEFKRRMQDCVQHAYSWPLRAASEIVRDGCFHNEFEYFCAWLISRGRDTFDAAVRNADSLADLSIDDRASCEFEPFLEAPYEAYKRSTGMPFPH